MKLIMVFYFLSFFLSFEILNAQDVNLKKDKIYIDDKEVLSYTKNNFTGEFSIYELNTKNELMFIQYHDNETSGYKDDDYVKIKFITLNKALETTIAHWPEKLVAWFIENSVFDNSGNLNPEKVDLFIEKYDERITERTVR